MRESLVNSHKHLLNVCIKGDYLRPSKKEVMFLLRFSCLLVNVLSVRRIRHI